MIGPMTKKVISCFINKNKHHNNDFDDETVLFENKYRQRFVANYVDAWIDIKWRLKRNRYHDQDIY